MYNVEWLASILPSHSIFTISHFTFVMSDNVQEIKSRLAITDVLKSYITLLPAGKNLKANCPFHHEKSPSFMVSPERQMWHCFGCGEGGDIFKFVMKFENIEFFEALKLLAEKAGVEIQHTAGAGDAYKHIYEINRIAKDLFCSNLHGLPSAHQAAASAYLQARGLTQATIKEFEIGLASTLSDALLRHMVAQKKILPDVEKAGLVFKSERGTYWDRFRGRIMFPLYNNFGKVVGFTGRVMPGATATTGIDAAKYVNSPETPIFSKSKLLYGFHFAKNAIRDTKTVIVVEGQMDFLMMWQDGIKNVVASSGTALTHEQLTTLRRSAENIILSFDMDEAGLAAAERSIDLAAAQDFNIKILEIKGDYKDPADVVVFASGKMAEFVAAAVPAMDWYFHRYIKEGGDITARKKNVRVLLSKIKQIASPIEREHFINELSRRTGMGASALLEEMTGLAGKELRSENFKTPEVSVVVPVKLSRRDLISERILFVLAADPEFKKEALPYLAHFSERYSMLLEGLGVGGFSNVPSELAGLADDISMRATFGVGGAAKVGAATSSASELKTLLSELRLVSLKEKMEAARFNIAKAEVVGDEEALSAALKEFDSIKNELHNVT